MMCVVFYVPLMSVRVFDIDVEWISVKLKMCLLGPAVLSVHCNPVTDVSDFMHTCGYCSVRAPWLFCCIYTIKHQRRPVNECSQGKLIL